MLLGNMSVARQHLCDQLIVLLDNISVSRLD